MIRSKRREVLSRSPGVRRRIYLIFGGIGLALVVVVAIVAVAAFRSRPGSGVPSAGGAGASTAAVAQPAQASQASQAGVPSETPREGDAKPCRELQELMDRFVKKGLPRVAIAMLDAYNPTTVRMELQAAGTQRELTDLEKALDPDAHSFQEITATVASLLADLDFLSALEAEAVARNGDLSTGTYQVPLERLIGAAWWQVRSDSGEGSPEEVLGRWVRTGRFSEARVRREIGTLNRIVNRLPGAVPERLAQDILSCFRDTPDMSELSKEATTLCDKYDRVDIVLFPDEPAAEKPKESPIMSVVYDCVRLDKDNYFLKRRRPARNRGMNELRSSLTAIMSRPPCLARRQLEMVEGRIPPQSHNVSCAWNSIRFSYYFAWADAYFRDAVRIALALKAHRAVHGAYPESLQELVPEQMEAVPICPVTGGLPTYERKGDGFELIRPEYRVREGDTVPIPSSVVWRARN